MIDAVETYSATHHSPLTTHQNGDNKFKIKNLETEEHEDTRSLRNIRYARCQYTYVISGDVGRVERSIDQRRERACSI